MSHIFHDFEVTHTSYAHGDLLVVLTCKKCGAERSRNIRITGFTGCKGAEVKE